MERLKIEGMAIVVDTTRIAELITDLLWAIGEDPTREGLRETPARVARLWSEFIDYDPGRLDTTFEAVTTDQMVVVKNIQVWSMCEHHLLPFTCNVAIGYIARTRVLGLSKFARIAKMCAHKLQIQERLVHEIADEVERLTNSPDVAVFASGTHLCMAMRGARTDAVVQTSVVRGAFLEKDAARAEFFNLV